MSLVQREFTSFAQLQKTCAFPPSDSISMNRMTDMKCGLYLESLGGFSMYKCEPYFMEIINVELGAMLSKINFLYLEIPL